MDNGIDFGSTAGFRERAKKKKGATNKFDPWGDSEKKEDGSAGGDGTGDNDNAGDGGSAGGGGGAGNGGDDNNNGDNGGEDDWGFSTGKKTKKKTKKRQDEEDEEEGSKTKNEEEPSADPLSWANDTNENAGDDWTNSWSTGKKEKKKKVCIIRHTICHCKLADSCRTALFNQMLHPRRHLAFKTSVLTILRQNLTLALTKLVVVAQRRRKVVVQDTIRGVIRGTLLLQARWTIRRMTVRPDRTNMLQTTHT